MLCNVNIKIIENFYLNLNRDCKVLHKKSNQNQTNVILVC